MKKKFGLISMLACLGLACVAVGCGANNELEAYQKDGYNISVTYDPNGGRFTGRDGVSMMDLFNPSKKTADENGNVHFQLVEPTDPSREAAGSQVELTMSGHFFAGWYHTRHLVKNTEGQPVDANGNVLEEKDGKYYYVGTSDEAVPAYTYEGYWDFEKDLIYSGVEGKLDWEFEEELVYTKNDGMYNITLYAGWVPNYTFEYYYQASGETDWTLLGSSTFNYKATNAENSETHDWDTIWLPDWKDGAMNHSFHYENQQLYEFPKIDGYTFDKAYTDEECTQEITTATFTHTGSLDLQHGVAINPVQKIYIVAKQGEYYKISKAEDLSKNANLKGIYEIAADLDFKNGEVRWPSAFTAGEFTGKMVSTASNTFRIKNVVATFSSTQATSGGLFGKIGANAVIQNLVFENATLNLNGVLYSKSDLEDATYGLFAGYIDENATVTGITVGGAIRIGAANNWKNTYLLSLSANGNVNGVTKTAVKVYVYGEYLWEEDGVEYYDYAVDEASVVVADGYVNFALVPNLEAGEKTQAEFYIGEY